jgi:hypothetical protein
MRIVAVFLILSFNCVIINYAQYCDGDSCDNVIQSCKQFDRTTFNKNSPSIIYGEAAGRFGNHFLGYIVLLQLSRQLGVDAYINKECHNYMLQFFTPESVTMPVLNETYCNIKDMVFQPYHGPFRDLVNFEEYRKGKMIYFYPSRSDSKGGYRPEDHVCKEQEDFSREYIKYIKENMEWKNGISAKAQGRLIGVSRQMKKDANDITYVGVHVRRTDHIAHMKKLHQFEPLDAEYFLDSMDYFREEYDNCAFIVASDDMDWVVANIENTNGDVFFSTMKPTYHKNKNGNLMDDDVDKAVYDLALLTSCNHTIISRGTYSMWVALLAGGEYYTEYGSIGNGSKAPEQKAPSQKHPVKSLPTKIPRTKCLQVKKPPVKCLP